MPRGGSRGRSSSPAPPPRQAPTASRPMPAQQTTPVQTSSGGGLLSGIGSTIMQGMAFGAGSEVAHQAVRSLMGGSSHSQQAPQQAPQQQQTSPCQFEMDNFSRCLSSNDNVSYCQNYADMLKNCKQTNNLLWLISNSKQSNQTIPLIKNHLLL